MGVAGLPGVQLLQVGFSEQRKQGVEPPSLRIKLDYADELGRLLLQKNVNCLTNLQHNRIISNSKGFKLEFCVKHALHRKTFSVS